MRTYVYNHAKPRNLTMLLLLMVLSSFASDINEKQNMLQNPVSYFEIPVLNLDRAIGFYEYVFDVTLEKTDIDGHEMSLFPYNSAMQGISGALAKGESYKPSQSGPRIYFFVEDIDEGNRPAVT